MFEFGSEAFIAATRGDRLCHRGVGASLRLIEEAGCRKSRFPGYRSRPGSGGTRRRNVGTRLSHVACCCNAQLNLGSIHRRRRA